MTINSTTNRVAYTGNGTANPLAVSFPFFTTADLVVVETVIATGVQATKVLTTDYTVTGTPDANGNYSSGGAVVPNSAIANTLTWTIYRDPAVTQLVQHVDNDPLPAASIDTPLDKLTMISQRTREIAVRSLHQPDGDTAVMAALPSKVARAGLALSFDSNGDPTVADSYYLLAQAAAANAIAAESAVTGSALYAQTWVASVKNAPVGGESDGTRYLVGTSPTGTFAAHANTVAMLVAGTWVFATPGEGQEVFVQDSYTVYRYKAAAWSKARTIVAPGDTLATAMASGASAFVFTAGTYTDVGITIPSNCALTTVGKVVLQTTSTTVPILDFTSAVNVTMRGHWKLQGNGSSNTGNPPAGATNSGQNAIKLYNSVGIDIDGYTEICNIKGYGIDEHAPASTFAVPGLNSIRGIRAHDCYFGAYVRDFAEYSKYSDCWFYNNICGVKDESGNRGYHNCFMVFNQFGFFLDGTAEPGNNSHGIVSGCFINHNTTNITCDTATLGMLFVGCQIISEPGGSGHGVVNIINGSKLIQFTGCGFGSNVLIDATSEVNFVGNTIRSTLSNAPAVIAGGVCRGDGNIDENGAQASLWNGMNSLTPTISFGGLSVGVTYAENDGRVKYDSGFLDFTLEIALGSKGSSTGVVLINPGLPAVLGPVPNNVPITVYGAGMNAAVTDLKGFMATGTGTIKLYNFNAGALTQLTDTAFTGTDTLYVSGRVPLG